MYIILYFEAGLSGRAGPEMVLNEITLLKKLNNKQINI